MFKIIATETCPHCLAAKDLLDALDFPYEVEVLDTAEKKAAFKASGFETVPQIYRDNFLIGGHSDLVTTIKDKLAWH
jgi:glutaredoxin